MLELSAQGPDARQRWRMWLMPGTTCTLGRAIDADLPVMWDDQVSSHHAELTVRDSGVELRRRPSARNPVFFQGAPVETCSIPAGRHFVIGETIFRVRLAAESDVTPGERLIEELAFTPRQLKRIRYQDPENRLEVLTHLPDVIAGARDDAELHHRLVNLLLKGVVHAEAVALVSLAEEELVRVWHWERRRETAGELRPSRRLTREALAHRRNSVLHVWEKKERAAPEQTLAAEFDWAFCTPVTGLAAEPTGLYVAGKMGPTFVPGTTLSDAMQLEADVKFTELVAEIFGAVVRARRMERQRAGLRQFFAPPILAALGDELDTTLLEPCECDVAVMFCDLRGFSQRAEHAGGDLIGLLERVSRASA